MRRFGKKRVAGRRLAAEFWGEHGGQAECAEAGRNG